MSQLTSDLFFAGFQRGTGFKILYLPSGEWEFRSSDQISLRNNIYDLITTYNALSKPRHPEKTVTAATAAKKWVTAIQKAYKHHIETKKYKLGTN